MSTFDPRRVPSAWSDDAVALLAAIDDATATPIAITYRLAGEWFDGVHDVIDDVESLAARDDFPALDLIEHLLRRLDRSVGTTVDDSDGGFVDVLDRLLELHRQLAGPDAAPPSSALS